MYHINIENDLQYLHVYFVRTYVYWTKLEVNDT